MAAIGCGRGGSSAGDGGTIALFSLEGASHRPIPTETDSLTVLVFTASDCPVANGYAPSLRAVHDEYAGRGVRFFLVNVEAGTSAEELRGHADEYDLPRPILMDSGQRLARQVGAEITPEAVVLEPGGAIAYRGRIDDRFPDLGVRRSAATTSELRDALDAVLAGRDVAVPRTEAIGCLIEDWAP